MKCPKCGSSVGDHDAVCPGCGEKLFEEVMTAIIPDADTYGEPVFFEEPEKEDKKATKKGLGRKDFGLKEKLTSTKAKIILILTGIVLIALIVILIVMHISTNKGKNTASKVSKYIGAEIETADSKIDAEIKDRSAYAGLNNAVQFDYVIEAGDSVKVDGIIYPEWAVLISVGQEDRIESVKYADFRVLKKNIKGEERDSVVNMDKFTKGESFGTVSGEIDLDYYSIVYTKDSQIYTYKYWYTTENGDVQPVILSVTFDSDGDYTEYSSTLLYPEYM